ncbi:Stk1 family PASTA domain-containing Ser/Thr kinase [Trichococcus pasteurii]|uniref:non-specific serine/threonine protein kinase n=1 Tax=Trichococcus pasteurii TaxID=43064 RepID=A0A1W1ICQ8_9LACT|nr:Stk1 family PASTA domain-containing Ser/Thr kinase [Trichococcus pasteurii]SFE39364.1 serine/threonine protein kinase [Trichococcus pasteurii]SLM50780.1 serine/threonine-protein kinase active site [Trichococcus pasteurii]SSB91661.1 serine/threonine-protein kinase active site [Trichococcus pasteurii]
MEAGKKLGGRYKIVRHIGSGGMANVYLGHDLILDRPVAIKVLRFDFRNNKDALRRFQREALSATQLIHPNIVGVYDVDEEDELQYIVMEFIDGTDLKKYIDIQGRVSPEKSIHIMHQVLSAVALAHKNRIIHRDIKPQNILIDNQDRIKITDFGIAVALSETSITQTNTLLGSVHYLSPEQARGSMATSKSDIYALGVVLYELLSGSVPFDGESAVSVALKHFQEPMPSIRESHPEIPQSLENVILKATAKEPLDRYATCEEMMEDLDTCLSEERRHEAPFMPVSLLQETKVLAPLSAEVVAKADLDKTLVSPPPSVKAEPIQEYESGREAAVGKKKRKKWTLVLFLLLLLGLIASFFFFFYNNQDADAVTVPDVSNMDQASARLALEDAGLVLGDITEEYSDEVEEDFVIETSPKIGSSVEAGDEIDLIISLGEELFMLLDYEGQAYESVLEDLRKEGFTIERTHEFSSEVAEGNIISQSIEPGAEVKPSETTLSFLVSDGNESYTMRDLSGYTRKSVEDYAGQYGLSLTVTEAYSDTVAAGLVVSQSLAGGTAFVSGDALSVVISIGPEEPQVVSFSRTITIPYLAAAVSEPASESSNSQGNENADSSSSNEPNHIVIYMQDEDHVISDVFREFDISADEVVTLNFRILEGSSASYRIERDGEVISEASELTQ